MHWAWAVAQKPFDAAARQSLTREVAASHLVSPSRLQVARQSYILEVSHIHLCDRRRSLLGHSPPRPLLVVPNVTAHPSMVSVPTSYYSM